MSWNGSRSLLQRLRDARMDRLTCPRSLQSDDHRFRRRRVATYGGRVQRDQRVGLGVVRRSRAARRLVRHDPEGPRSAYAIIILPMRDEVHELAIMESQLFDV